MHGNGCRMKQSCLEIGEVWNCSPQQSAPLYLQAEEVNVPSQKDKLELVPTWPEDSVQCDALQAMIASCSTIAPVVLARVVPANQLKWRFPELVLLPALPDYRLHIADLFVQTLAHMH